MLRSNVKEMMQAMGVSIRGLEQATGLSTRTIQNARTDAGIAGCSLSTLERIARALGCSIHDLFEDDPGQGGKDGQKGATADAAGPSEK